MRYLTLGEVVELHRLVLAATGGAPGIRDLGALESAVAQPRATFAGNDLHRSLIEKAAALGFALAQGHAFVDGNKRVAHAVMATQERLMLDLASGRLSRVELTGWLQQHVRSLPDQAV